MKRHPTPAPAIRPRAELLAHRAALLAIVQPDDAFLYDYLDFAMEHPISCQVAALPRGDLAQGYGAFFATRRYRPHCLAIAPLRQIMQRLADDHGDDRLLARINFAIEVVLRSTRRINPQTYQAVAALLATRDPAMIDGSVDRPKDICHWAH